LESIAVTAGSSYLAAGYAEGQSGQGKAGDKSALQIYIRATEGLRGD